MSAEQEFSNVSAPSKEARRQTQSGQALELAGHITRIDQGVKSNRRLIGFSALCGVISLGLILCIVCAGNEMMKETHVGKDAVLEDTEGKPVMTGDGVLSMDKIHPDMPYNKLEGVQTLEAALDTGVGTTVDLSLKVTGFMRERCVDKTKCKSNTVTFFTPEADIMIIDVGLGTEMLFNNVKKGSGLETLFKHLNNANSKEDFHKRQLVELTDEHTALLPADHPFVSRRQLPVLATAGMYALRCYLSAACRTAVSLAVTAGLAACQKYAGKTAAEICEAVDIAMGHM